MKKTCGGMMMSPKTWYFCLSVGKGRGQEDEKFRRITRSGYFTW